MNLPLIGIAAYSGSGKTTLLTKLLPALSDRGIRTAVIKHAHHQFDVDTPGKDSYKIRKAGASQTLVASSQRWALMTETPDSETVDLDYLVGCLDTEKSDLIIVEGFKELPIPKIMIHRTGANKPMPEISAETLAIATDNADIKTSLPLLDLNNIDEICDFIIQTAGLKKISDDD